MKSQLFAKPNRSDFQEAAKVGVASLLSLLLGYTIASIAGHKQFFLDPLWCLISTILVSQARLGATYAAAWVRLLGTLIGAFLGSLITYSLGNHPIVIALSLSITYLFCSLLRLKESIRIASLNLVIISLLSNGSHELSIFTFALVRIIDSIAGISVAVFVTHVMWPYSSIKVIIDLYLSLLAQFSKLCFLIDHNLSEKEIRQCRQALGSLEKEFYNTIDESHFEISSQGDLDLLNSFKELCDAIEENLMSIADSYRISLSKGYETEDLPASTTELLHKVGYLFQFFSQKKNKQAFLQLDELEKLCRDLREKMSEGLGWTEELGQERQLFYAMCARRLALRAVRMGQLLRSYEGVS